MPKFPVTLAFSTLAMGLAGCGVVPAKVNYTEQTATGESAIAAYPFRLRRSILLVTKDDLAKPAVVKVAPSELGVDGKYRTLYWVKGVDNWRSTTQLKVTYLDNTKLPDTFQSTTQDNIADTINKIGSLAAAVVPVVAGLTGGTAAVPGALAFKATTVDPDETGVDAWHPDKINPGYCVRLRDANTEQGTTVASYFTSRKTEAARDFPVPSCVTATLDIAPCSGGVVSNVTVATIESQQVTFSSGSEVTPLPIPSSGTIKMNSACGAAVTEADKQDRTDLLTDLTTLATQVKNVQAAKTKKN